MILLFNSLIWRSASSPLNSARCARLHSKRASWKNTRPNTAHVDQSLAQPVWKCTSVRRNRCVTTNKSVVQIFILSQFWISVLVAECHEVPSEELATNSLYLEEEMTLGYPEFESHSMFKPPRLYMDAYIKYITSCSCAAFFSFMRSCALSPVWCASTAVQSLFVTMWVSRNSLKSTSSKWIKL